jgi:hypothetical protein
MFLFAAVGIDGNAKNLGDTNEKIGAIHEFLALPYFAASRIA